MRHTKSTTIPSIPDALTAPFAPVRAVFHAASWELLWRVGLGLVVGDAGHSLVRAALVGPWTAQWRRLHRCFHRNAWPERAVIAALVTSVLLLLYGSGLPDRLFWAVDTTLTPHPGAPHMPGVSLRCRSRCRPGETRRVPGHQWVVLAHLWERAGCWVGLPVGARLVTPASRPLIVLHWLVSAAHLPLSSLLVVDRGLATKALLRWAVPRRLHVLGRLKRSTVVYDPPPPRPAPPGPGRPREYGPPHPVPALPPTRTRPGATTLVYQGKTVAVTFQQGCFRWRRVPGLLRVLVVTGPWAQPWYLRCTDRALDPARAVRASAARWQVEVLTQDSQRLGLGHYRGRTARGVRRWPLVVCLATCVLPWLRLERIHLPLPAVSWPWYPVQNTPGMTQVRLQACWATWQAHHHCSPDAHGPPIPTKIPDPVSDTLGGPMVSR
ncbi:MAG: hypothetical protein HY335_04345 [Deinococcus sp.]|nr:hypothetical protein [Deinococcus sp.]